MISVKNRKEENLPIAVKIPCTTNSKTIYSFIVLALLSLELEHFIPWLVQGVKTKAPQCCRTRGVLLIHIGFLYWATYTFEW